MFTCILAVIVLFSVKMHCEDDIGEVTINDLALRNARGLPKQILFNSFSDATKSRGYVMDSELQDTDFLATARNSALAYISDSMPEEINPGMCDYSWIAWIPFSGCPAVLSKSQPFYNVEETYEC